MDCAETIDCLGWYNHFNNINHSNPQIQCMFPSLYVVSNFFHQYLSFPSAGLLLPQGGLYLAFYSLWYNADSESLSDMSDSLRPHGFYSPWNSPGQNTGVGSIFLLQGISPTQESNPGLPHCRQFFTLWATREALYEFPSPSLYSGRWSAPSDPR